MAPHFSAPVARSRPSNTWSDSTLALHVVPISGRLTKKSLVSVPGRFGQRDLAGSLWEWVLDSSAPYLDTPCVDCANLDAHAGRVFRGGDFKLDDPDALRVGTRYGFEPAFPDQTRGLRCARSALP